MSSVNLQRAIIHIEACDIVNKSQRIEEIAPVCTSQTIDQITFYKTKRIRQLPHN